MRIDQFAGQNNEWQEGIIFVLGKTGEEKSTAHTLYPTPPFTDVQPQLFGVFDMLDQATVHTKLADEMRGRALLRTQSERG